MMIIQPITVADADYTGGNLTEDQYDEWSDNTAYVRGNFVRIDSVHSVYQCLTDHTSEDGTNDPVTEAEAFADPLTADPEPAHWVYFSQTNKWRVFDGRPSQRATPPSTGDPIEVEVTVPQRINVIALVEIVDGGEATVEIFDSDGNETFSETYQLNDTDAIQDWFDYFYQPNRLLDSLLVTGLPITTDGDEVHVTISGGDDLACGMIVMGIGEQFGFPRPGTGLETLDFSKVDVNYAGDLVTVRRSATSIYRFESRMDSELVNAFIARLKELRGGRRALFVASDTRGVRAWQYGFARKLRIRYVSHESADASLDAQGVV